MKSELIHTEFGKIMDMNEEEFCKYCNEKDLGFLFSFSNYLKIQFERVNKMREDCIIRLEKELQGSEEVKSALVSIYCMLSVIENKYLLVQENIKVRELIT